MFNELCVFRKALFCICFTYSTLLSIHRSKRPTKSDHTQHQEELTTYRSYHKLKWTRAPNGNSRWWSSLYVKTVSLCLRRALCNDSLRLRIIWKLTMAARLRDYLNVLIFSYANTWWWSVSWIRGLCKNFNNGGLQIVDASRSFGDINLRSDRPVK